MFLFGTVCFVAVIALVGAINAHNKRMLGFVPGLHEPMLDIASTGYYEQHIDHVDVYGGYTKSNTIVKLRQDRFVLVDDLNAVARTADAEAWLVSCTADDVYVRANRAPVFGDILIGTAMQKCCAAAAAAKHARDANAAAAGSPLIDGLPLDMEMLDSLCGRQVSRVSVLDAAPDAAGLRAFRVAVVDVDVLPLVEHLSVQFMHRPGNASEEEARHEMRRRGNFIDLEKTERFDNIRWNYDAKADAASKKDFDIPFTAFNGFPSVCNECFLDFAASFEFDLLVTRTLWGLPKVQLLRVMFNGDLQLATRISVTVPYSRSLISFSKDLAPRVEFGKFTVPAGPFGITLRASFGPVLTMGVTASAQVTVSHGSRTRIQTAFGILWKAGQGLPSIVIDSNTTNSFPGSTIGPFGVSPVQSKQLNFYIGIAMSLRVDVGLNWLPLALLPLVPSPEFFAASIGVGPRLQMTVKYLDDKSCLGYELGRGVSVGTTLSALFVKIGRWKIGFSHFLGFPFFGLVDLLKVQVPADCDVCRACLPATDKLPEFVQKAVTVATKNPDKMEVLMLPRVENITVWIDQKNFTLGRNITLNWKAPARTTNVFFAIERRRSNDEYKEDEPTQYPLYTGAVPIKNNSLPLELNRLLGATSSLVFEARAVAPDMNSGDLLRIYVCDKNNEQVFGNTDWLAYVNPSMAPKSKFWLYSGWSDCINECGAEDQTRDAYCVNEIGDKTDGCDATAKEAVKRDCENPVCQFQSISVVDPQEGDLIKSEDNGNIKLGVQANGGLTELRYDVRLCADGEGQVACEKPEFSKLRCVLVGTSAPGERKEHSFSLSQFRLERHKLRLLGVQMRALVSVQGEAITSAEFASRRSFSGVFTVAAERRYKLDVPDKVPQPKAFFVVGSAGVSDGKNGDDQFDVGEVQYVWASPEWVNRTDIKGTTLVISSPDPLLGGPAVPTEKLTLTFNVTTGISTCAPHDRLLATGTPECKASWTNVQPLLECPRPAEQQMTPDTSDAARVTTGAAAAAAAALAAYGAMA
jgi:hypothetical protein